MANFVYTVAAKELRDGTIDLVTDTLKVMLVTDLYVPDQNAANPVADAGGSADPVDAEITATNYTRGWGGAGRKTLGARTVTANTESGRVEIDTPDIVWTALGGAVNDTVKALLVVKEGGANDTTTRLVAYIDTVSGTPPLPYPTSGVDLTYVVAPGGLLNDIL